MGNIVAFGRKKTHFSGEARCLQCHHEWVAVAEAGDVMLECPECGTHKGLFIGEHVPPEGTPVWECKCGNQYFNITPDGAWCPNCGVYSEFP